MTTRRLRTSGILLLGAIPLSIGGACSGDDFDTGPPDEQGGESGAPGRGGNDTGGTSGASSGAPSGGSGTSRGGEGGEPDMTGGRAGNAGRGGSGTSGDGGDSGTGGDGGSGGASGSNGAGSGGKGGSNNAGNGGSNNAGSGGSNAGAGSGGGGAGPGGTGGTGGTSGASGTGGAGGLPANCIVRVAEANQPVIYSGAAYQNTCNPYIDPPRSGVFRSTGDGTSAATAVGILGGRSSAPDCAMHNVASNFLDWGGGMAFGLNMSQSAFCRYDASVFQGVRMYLKGYATGSTSSPSGGLANNWVRVGLATVQTASTDEGGTCMPSGGYTCNDHFAKFCQLGNDWTLCDLSLSGSGLSRWGFGAPGVTFSKGYLVEIVFEVHRATSVAAVSFDYMVDDITFY